MFISIISEGLRVLLFVCLFVRLFQHFQRAEGPTVCLFSHFQRDFD